MAKVTKKEEHYSNLKTALRIITLIMAIWALVKVYQLETKVQWLEQEHDHVIEKLMFDGEQK